MSSIKSTRRGDTIVEVLFAVAIFGVVAIVAIQMMNRGTVIVQTAIEAQQARNEMDAQVAAINFIHNGFLAERGHPVGVRQFEELWDRIIASPRSAAPPLHPPDRSCDFAMLNSPAAPDAFVINTRALLGRGSLGYDATKIVRRPNTTGSSFIVAPIYPRIVFAGTDGNLLTETAIFDDVVSVEGLQVFAVASANLINGQPEFFDFHVRSCWRPAGQNTDTKLSTIIRSLNPRVIE
jgi:hypothetical protein